MNDCTRTAALLDVYADDETSAETNALVHEHLHTCGRCARELQDILSLRAELRSLLGGEHASPALRGRIVAAVDERARHPLVGTLRNWLALASAAAVLLALWMMWDIRADPLAEAAVAEHVACALHGRATRFADAVAVERGYPAAMPWIRDAAHDSHVVDAHTCGDEPVFSHLVLSVAGSTASILIAPRTGAARATIPPTIHGNFEVGVLTTPKHVVYVVFERSAAGVAREWRASALERVGRFLQQLEGTL